MFPRFLAFFLLPLLLHAEPKIAIDADFPGGNILVQQIEGDTGFLAPDLRDTQQGVWLSRCPSSCRSGFCKR